MLWPKKWNDKESRSSQIKKNILGSLMTKGISMITSLLYVPITLNYLNETRYGIWMTLTSIVAWIAVFDVGLANGLRNKLTEAIALNKSDLAQKLVSTTYALLFGIVLIILVLFSIVNPWVSWSDFLNAPKVYDNELSILAWITVFFSGFRFVLSVITTILSADQRPALGSSLDVISSVFSLIGIVILTQTNNGTLLLFGFISMAVPVIIFSIASVFFFQGKYASMKPRWRHIDFSCAKGLFSLGIQFFIIQISGLVIFQTSNILISRFFSPEEVTPFNVIFKYYWAASMIWGVILTPLWSAYTQALAQEDYNWIRKTMSKFQTYFFLIAVLFVVMFFCSNSIIDLWTGGKVHVNLHLNIYLAIYTLLTIWNTLYAVLLNGIGVVKIQMNTAIVGSLIHLPMSYIFIKFGGMGSDGVVLSMIISTFLFAIIGPLKVQSIFRTWKNA